jgi:5,5'-dehydrodivanillate O-demethylase
MLSVEANDRLARVGPGTPMGVLMRRYWMPIRPLAQLVDEDVIKVRILGEDLVLFRTKRGEIGLIGDRCPHRQTGMEFGIPDDDGLRCCYHGWMFDTAGQCIDTPLEAPDSTFKERVRTTAYPARELGGLVWAYLGPSPAPLLPPWDVLVMPNAIRQIGVVELNANWLQCQENTGDPAHSVYLHGHLFKYQLEKRGLLDDRASEGQMHTLFSRMKAGIGIESVYAIPSQYGFEKGIKYSKELGAARDETRRHSTVMFPFFTQTGGSSEVRQELQMRVPVDDTHTYHINYGCFIAPDGVIAPEQEQIPWYEVPIYDENGKALLDFVLAQDMVAWWSQGELTDRSKEKLGRTDTPIILMRRQFEQQMRIVEDGGDPMNVFRDPSTMPDVIHGGSWDESLKRDPAFSTAGGFRSAYHRGYGVDDADRYGPAMPQIIDLMWEIERAGKAQS